MYKFRHKLLYGENGSFTVEASLILPAIFLCVITLLVAALYYYQKTSLYVEAGTAAERAAFTWDNSGKNPLTGAISPGIHDGLYWRLLEDYTNSSLTKKKLALVSQLYANREEVQMDYRNIGIERTVLADMHKGFPFFPALREMWNKTQTEAASFSRVVDPVEFIRTVDLARTYFPLLKDRLGNLRFGSLVKDRAPSDDDAGPKAFPTEAQARNYLQTKLVHGKEVDVGLSNGRMRKIDALDNEGIAHQAYLGYIPNRSSLVEGERINIQLEKDIMLLKDGKVKGVVWHFFQSEKTGKIGPSGPLLRELQKAGILVVIHNISDTDTKEP